MKQYTITFNAISEYEVNANSKDEAWKKADEIFSNGVEWAAIDTELNKKIGE